jgi:hypothetical protein
MNGSITCSTNETLAILIWNMRAIHLKISLGKSEVQQKYFVRGLIESNTEVIGFNVSMKKFHAV